MNDSKLIENLQNREIITQITNSKDLKRRVSRGSIAIYCGFDPTSDSLHLGHLVPLLCLKHFQEAGHKIVLLLGGATALIGDPSFKKIEREFSTQSTIFNRIQKITKQLRSFFQKSCEKSPTIVNNYDWFKTVHLISFLRDTGKHFSVNQMIQKESVKRRFNRSEIGISFTEFSYSLLQSYDFFYLNQMYNIELQIGGADQWGNITSGIDLIRRVSGNNTYGMTVPLITISNGIKLGKTEKGTIWLDPKKTSPYEFYQFWINIEDKDVFRFLNIFTSIDSKTIKELEQERKSNQGKPQAQYLLADEVTRMVHGEKNLELVKRITNHIFQKNITKMDLKDILQLIHDGFPVNEIVLGTDLASSLKKVQPDNSLTKIRKLISSNSIAVNDKKQSDIEYKFVHEDYLFGTYTLLRIGKKRHYLIKWMNKNSTNE